MQSHSPLVHASAAALATALSFSALFPLDTLRLRMQAHTGPSSKSAAAVLLAILRQEGFAGLYRGLPGAVTALVYANFVYFFAQNRLKGRATSLTGHHALTVPALAGLSTVLLSAPIFSLSTRFRLSGETLWTCIRAIARDEGTAGFFKGLGPSLWLVLNPGIQYAVMERLKLILRPTSSLQFFLLGAFAKACATLATYPLQLAQTLLRAQRARTKQQPIGACAEAIEGRHVHGSGGKVEEVPSKQAHYAGMIDCLQQVHARGGLPALYRGLQAKALQTVFTAALQNMVYERLLRQMQFKITRQEGRRTAQHSHAPPAAAQRCD